MSNLDNSITPILDAAIGDRAQFKPPIKQLTSPLAGVVMRICKGQDSVRYDLTKPERVDALGVSEEILWATDGHRLLIIPNVYSLNAREHYYLTKTEELMPFVGLNAQMRYANAIKTHFFNNAKDTVRKGKELRFNVPIDVCEYKPDKNIHHAFLYANGNCKVFPAGEGPQTTDDLVCALNVGYLKDIVMHKLRVKNKPRARPGHHPELVSVTLFVRKRNAPIVALLDDAYYTLAPIRT